MILRRYHGPVSDALSSNQVLGSNVSQNGLNGYEEDRGFLNMAINHLQNDPIPGKGNERYIDSSSHVVTKADVNQHGGNQYFDDGKNNAVIPGNARRYV